MLRSGAGAHFHAPSLVTGLDWQLAASYLSSNTKVFVVAPNNDDDDVTNSIVRQTKSSKHNNNSSELSTDASSRLPIFPLHSVAAVECTNSEVAIVVSELPLTAEATRFVTDSGGFQLQLPSTDGVRLLNCAVSGSIAAFELARRMRRIHS